jgi:hypothetical protein
LIDVFEGFLQGENINDYDGDHYDYDYEDSDIISPRIKMDAHEAECFPVSGNLSPRSSLLIPEENSKDLDRVSAVIPYEHHSIHNNNVGLTTTPSSPVKSGSTNLLWGLFPFCLGKCLWGQ